MKNRIEFANTLRGLAALSVVIYHYVGVFWFKRDAVASLINAKPLLEATHPAPIYFDWINHLFLINLGAYGVALFFIISGFVIPFSLQKANSGVFGINRLFRIIPTYIVGFSISLLFLLLSATYFSVTWPYSFKEILIHYVPGLRDLMWSRNIDGIIWTLEIEMKFYIVVALFISWFRQYSLNVFYLPCILFLMNCYVSHQLPFLLQTNANAYHLGYVYLFVSQFMMYMFIGVVFHYIYVNKMQIDKGYFIVGFFFALFYVAWSLGPMAVNIKDIVSYAFALLTFMFAYAYPRLFKGNVITNFMANISYPLYVVHGLAGYVILRVLLDLGFKTSIAMLFVLCFSFLSAWLIHFAVELPAQRLGKKWSAKLKNKNASLLNEVEVA